MLILKPNELNLSFSKRGFRALLHVLLCCQLLFANFVAVPGSHFLKCEESKSEPIEESVDLEDVTSILLPISVRRSGTNKSKPDRRIAFRSTRSSAYRRVFQSKSSRFLSGHRLANGLCAPQRC